MKQRIGEGIGGLTVIVWVCLAALLSSSAGFAADKTSDTSCHAAQASGGACGKAESGDVHASRIVSDYCHLYSRREIRGNVIDPKLTDAQAAELRANTYNKTEMKLLQFRQELMKLDHANVENALHSRMEESPDNEDVLMCALEIVARAYPKEYDDYAKTIKPGVDESGFVKYIRDTYLGKSAALHEEPSQFE